ncbi:MAG: GNAT family N-acetyltransferase [Methylophilaceae bacterium]
MKKTSELQIQQVTWQQAEQPLSKIRTAVFIGEQQIVPEFEWDEIDTNAVHLLINVNDQPIACLRIMDQHKIGRMAVLKAWRGKGVGMAILLEAIKLCRQFGSQEVTLSAQMHAIGFYKKAGFLQISDVYDDVGIPHVDMQLTL